MADYTLKLAGGFPDVLPLTFSRNQDRTIIIDTTLNLDGAVVQWVVKNQEGDLDSAELATLDNGQVGGITVLQDPTFRFISLQFGHGFFTNKVVYPATPIPRLIQAAKAWLADGTEVNLWEGSLAVHDFGILTNTAPPLVAVTPPTPVPVALGTYRVRHFVSGQPQADSAEAYTTLVGRGPGWLHFFQDLSGLHPSEPTAAPTDMFGVARATEARTNGLKDGSNNPLTVVIISLGPDDYTVVPEQNQPAWTNASILAGTHDAALNTFFTQAAAWGHPLLVAPMWEFTGIWYPWAAGANGNTPTSFKAAWQYLVTFGRIRAPLVKYIWCPSVEIPGSALIPMAQCWPGDAYVDYLGLNGYNKGKAAQQGKWYSPDQVFHASYDEICALSQKDVVIVETGCDSDAGADLALKAAWFGDMVTALKGLPRIRAINFFSKPFGSLNYAVDESPATLVAFQAMAADPYMQGTLDLS